MKYYKVVFERDDGTLTSAISNEVLKYSLDERTVPRFGAIFAFDTLENAKNFKGSVVYKNALRILRGPGKKSKFKKIGIYWPDVKPKVLKKFWDEKCSWGYCNVPMGTVLLEWFEPKEVIV